MALRRVSDTWSWAAVSANRRGRYFRAKAVWDTDRPIVVQGRWLTVKEMPQAPRSNDHRTYRCYLRGPDGIRGLSLCGPGALFKVFLKPSQSQPENPGKSMISGVFVQPIRPGTGAGDRGDWSRPVRGRIPTPGEPRNPTSRHQGHEGSRPGHSRDRTPKRRRNEKPVPGAPAAPEANLWPPWRSPGASPR